MNYLEAVKYCPYCGAKFESLAEEEMYKCSLCGKPFYIAVIIGAAGLIFNKQGELLVIRRARNPHKGALDVPAGFAHWTKDNSLEDTLRREVEEEMGIGKLKNIKYFGSYKAIYSYAEIEKTALTAYFTAEFDGEILSNLEEVIDYKFISINKIDLKEVGFENTRNALRDLINQTNS